MKTEAVPEIGAYSEAPLGGQVDFSDHDSVPCRIASEQSGHVLWIGPMPRVEDGPVNGVVLTRDQARAIGAILTRWAERGELVAHRVTSS